MLHEVKNVVQVGSFIPIVVQLHDGGRNRKVIFRILDPVGKLIGSGTLSEGSAPGYYFTNFFDMPDLPFVVVQVEVIGVDYLGQEYELASERFYSSPKPKPIEKVYRGRLELEQDTSKVLKGVLVETSIA